MARNTGTLLLNYSYAIVESIRKCNHENDNIAHRNFREKRVIAKDGDLEEVTS